MSSPPATRIGQLDFIRGLAVMGILLANLPAFGLPAASYFSPLAWGGHHGADRVAWFANFVLVEGKMRGLFSMLFGASMLLVIDRAAARGASPLATHLSRMAVLLVIGLVHLYLIWWGDILAHYALVGAIAFLFIRLPVRLLLFLSVVLLLLDLLLSGTMAAMLYGAAPPARDVVDEIVAAFGQPPRAALLAEIAAYRGSFVTAAAYRWAHAGSPLDELWIFGLQTLSAMLLGMAGYRSGFLTGGWSRRAYAWIAAVAIGVTLPLYVAIAAHSVASGFDYRWIFTASVILGPALRPVTTIGYAALALLAFRPDGRWTARIAATGRMAFSNYLGTSLLMLMLFTGAHRFATLPRATLYLLAPPLWAIMLAWSQPWLARFAYGPMEWLWRSASRARWAPMRVQVATRRGE
ncbi:DUF418 domain-containing protein [Sphingomonas adhaesiva]|uniref:DUF418 domain-containing protein n=1 Tax=Sphingomonas adhaesiva TaxID=28212 RepID=UPI002FF562E4